MIIKEHEQYIRIIIMINGFQNIIYSLPIIERYIISDKIDIRKIKINIMGVGGYDIIKKIISIYYN